MTMCTIVAATLAATVAVLISGFGGIYTGTELPPFVKVENVPDDESMTLPTFARSTEWFTSKGVRCHAWLYLPRIASGDGHAKPPPLVIMAHGMGSQKDMGLGKYAEAFAVRGMATFVFDYRTFGGSDGMPRNLVDPWRHIEDYKAALDHVRRTKLGERVDASRIALWGTSFAGGHVLRVAAEDRPPTHVGSIRAVVSQTPHLDGRAASKRSLKLRGVSGALKMVVATLGDHLRNILGMEARYVSIVGCAKSEVSLMMLTPDGCTSYFSKHPTEYLGGWRNQACARIGAMVGMYSPIKAIGQVEAPILFVAAEKDELCPADIVRKAVSEAQDASLSIHDNTHFEIYLGDVLEQILKDMTDFLELHLMYDKLQH